MRIVFELPSGLERFTTGQRSIELEGKTLGDLFDRLWQDHPDLRARILDQDGKIYPYLAVNHNQKRLIPEEIDRVTLQDGDTVEVMMLVSGG